MLSRISALVPRWLSYLTGFPFFTVVRADGGGGEMTCGRVSRGCRLFQVSRTANFVDVSKYCAVWPAPGMLCALVPAGISPLKPFEAVKARNTLADTPGLGLYPISRASSSTETRSVAVRRYPSLAMRS